MVLSLTDLIRCRSLISWKHISWWKFQDSFYRSLCRQDFVGSAGTSRQVRKIMRKNSIKNTRINGEVQKVLADVIRGEMKDPRISPLTSVVAVEVSPDLKTAKVWVSTLGDEKAQADTVAGLKSAEGFIRSKLAKELNLRNTPLLTFILDQSIAYGVNMTKKIDEVTKDL